MKLYYRKYGEGPTLIIVHGLYGASDNWVHIGKLLGKHFEVFIIDQRNHGRSPHSDTHNYHSMKKDLHEFIEEHSISKTILVGHSMGGKTVMSYAGEYPEKINGLVVVDIAPKSYLNSVKTWKNTIDHGTIIKAMNNVDFSTVKIRSDVDIVLKDHISTEMIRQFLMKNLHRNKDQTFKWSLNLKAIKNNLNDILAGFNENEFEAGNQITGFPVLFIRGSYSNYILDEDFPLIHKIFPYAEIKTIPETGHWLHVEKPDFLVSTILRYFIG